ncbi:MAG TPA: hypothetical protein VGJ09_16885 [Bryobacteraceae bacterium]
MARTQGGVPGYYVWAVPGMPAAVHLSLDVVDRLAAEFLRGFEAVPKRGAEVGGVLLGFIEPGQIATVRVEDFEPVPCTYVRGPSYLLTQNEREVFDQVCQRRSPVGYYRSHTREGLALGQEDIDLLEHNFPLTAHVALLVKPVAGEPGTAGFFVRENGVFPGATRLQFPFRRWEMTGQEPPAARAAEPAVLKPVLLEPDPPPVLDNPKAEAPRKPKSRAGIWLVAAFFFLLLGVLLGYEASQITAPRRGSDFALSLAVARNGDNLMVRWNRDAPAIRSAGSGLLEITDGGDVKHMELDRANLSGGSFIYRNTSDRVSFRLVVYLDEGVSVAEALDWPH